MKKQKMYLKTSQLGFKPFLILILILLFLIPLSLIKSLIRDRRFYQKEAVSSILEPLGGNLALEGVAVALPFKTQIEKSDEKGQKWVEEKTNYLLTMPEDYQIESNLNPHYLTRGIYRIPVFSGEVHIKGHFSPSDYRYHKIEEKNILWEEATLIIGISNKKNLTKFPEILASDTVLLPSLSDPILTTPFQNKIHYTISQEKLQKGFDFSGTLHLQGGESVEFKPLAGNNYFKLSSNWKTPSFSGGWLPNDRTVTKAGFSAEWRISGVSTQFPKSWISENSYRAYDQKSESVRTSFITSSDNYKKTEKSVKYALLFLLVPFLAIFLCEIFTGIRIHPIQYCLIGLADAIFYLLLLSISEHLPFPLSYLVSAVSVTFLTFFYAAAIFKKNQWGALLALVQSISYLFLFGTLQAEDYALLFGSLGLFFIILLLMILTKRVDWYAANPSLPNELTNSEEVTKSLE